MDKETRNAIERATQRARKLLEEDFAGQLEGVFDVHEDGTLAAAPGGHLSARQANQRERIIAAIQHKRAAGMSAADSVADYLRDAAFTTLNRFAALKMLEARELVPECITKGDQSVGYKEFCGMAPGLALLPDRAGYRLYIECVFDELATGLRTLFNRRDFAGILWPRRTCFEELLVSLNSQELAGIWAQDETVGWMYQYYNTGEERRWMRKESSAPRNSRELAIRNQFFTPRYVVEFLTDNTLGRIWYEMTRGETALVDCCRYLIRSPVEVVEKPGEAMRSIVGPAGNPTQKQVVQETVYIRHREIKDPREIRLLDPACGSMHFGLYAFDLFTVIYDEAWELAHGANEAKLPDTFAPFVMYAMSFANKADFMLEVPSLIIQNNLHGIDIDPRATQIAVLSLWLRAHRAWHEAKIRPADRPRVKRSNVVCAEPMPGEKELLNDFVNQRFLERERPLFKFILEHIFDRMTLAAEAGALLKIEDEILIVLKQARTLARSQSAPQQSWLLPDDSGATDVSEVNLAGLNDEKLWSAAEQRIYDALETYADQIENRVGFQRRLFSQDAAQGFAFINLCRKRYDVLVMNPPFGDRVLSCEALFKSEYGDGKLDLYHYFFERAETFLAQNGRIGAITPRTLLYQAHYLTLREKWLQNSVQPQAIVELDLGVLDAATVRPVLTVLGVSFVQGRTFYQNLKHSFDPASELCKAIAALNVGRLERGCTYHSLARFATMPGKRFSLWATENILHSFDTLNTLEPALGKVTEGLTNENDARFLRCWWETPQIHSGNWRTLAKFDSRSTFVCDFSVQIDWSEAGYNALGQLGNRRANERYYLQSGIAFTRSCEVGMAATSLPEGCIFAGVSRYFLPTTLDRLGLLAYLNTRLVEGLHLVLTPDRDRISGTLRKIPMLVSPRTIDDLVPLGREIWERKMAWLTSTDETHRQFVGLLPLVPWADFRSRDVGAAALKEQIYSLEERIEQCVTSSVSLGLDDLQILTDEVKERAGERDLVTWNRDLTSNTGAAAGVVAASVGFAFGRWDIRYASGQQSARELTDPFAPLPICPPGMLLGDDDLPLSPEAGSQGLGRGNYPIEVLWDGIMVDDPDHPLDLEAQVQIVTKVLWGEQAEVIRQDLYALLGVSTLREWFRHPTGFFADHLKRYSKSRRQAPIYWPLSTLTGSYTIWIYYNRSRRDLLYRCLELTKDKLQHEQRKLSRFLLQHNSTLNVQLRKEQATQENLISELTEFRESVGALVPLWNPDLNDGVLINYSPLWRLTGHKPWQKVLKTCWEELVAGQHDWARLAMHLWPERVLPKCVNDRSLAIAHGLEDVFWVESNDGKWSSRRNPTRDIDELIKERTSPAVKSALTSLLEAPVAAGNTGRGRGSRQKSANAARGDA